MNDQSSKELNEKLDLIIRLLSANIVLGKDYREQVQILNALGVKNKEVGIVTGKTENNVKVTLHHIKKQEEKKK